MFAEKKSKIEGLTQREKEVLFYVIQNKDIKIKDLSDKIGFAESSTRNFLSEIYKKLGISGDDQVKRDILYREYASEFFTLYPSLEAIQRVPEAPPIPAPAVFYPDQTKEEPQITRTPPVPQRRNGNGRLIAVLVSLLFISVCVIAILAGILINSIRPEEITQAVTTQPLTDTTEPVTIIETDTVTQPPTVTFTPEPTPTDYGFQPEQYPPAGSVIKVGQSFSKNGIFVVVPLEMVRIYEEYVGFKIVISNKRPTQYILRYQYQSFHVFDDLGNEIKPHVGFGDVTYEEVNQETIDPGHTGEVHFGRNITPISFKGIINQKATKLYFVIDEIGGMEKMTWEFDLQ
ncbi:MAG: hypothetical protein JW908_05635 [Anaerolineales bacterium]|nr:hypothetical protein [Anaerolineales bacterium]